MATNKETSIGIKLVADLRNYQSGMAQAQKTNTSFGKNAKQNLGDAKNSIQQLARGDITALPGLFRASNVASGGFSKGLKGVKAALVATGIGALIVGIGLAVGALTSYFKNTEEGQIVFKKVMNNVKSYVEPVLQMFGRFGKALVQLFKGDFAGAWDTAKEAITGVGDQIVENQKHVGELNRIEEEYIQNKRKFLLENKQLEAEIAEARRIANDEDNYSASERARYINEAIEKQKQLAANKQKLADQELKIEEIKASFGDNDIATNDKLAELKSRQYEITREQEMAIKRMGEDQQRINRELSAQIENQRIINAQIQDRKEMESVGLKLAPIKQPVKLEVQNPDESLKGVGEIVKSNAEKIQLMNEAMAVAASEDQVMMINSLSSSFSTLGSAIGGTTGNFISMAGTILEQIPTLIGQISALTTSQVASSQAITVAKGSEALASGTAASQAVPFPGNLIALAATIASIVGALKTNLKFATGGIVPGASFTGDKVLAGLNSSEMVLNQGQQSRLFAMANGMVTPARQQAPSPTVIVSKTRISKGDILISYEQAKKEQSKRMGK